MTLLNWIAKTDRRTWLAVIVVWIFAFALLLLIALLPSMMS